MLFILASTSQQTPAVSDVTSECAEGNLLI